MKNGLKRCWIRNLWSPSLIGVFAIGLSVPILALAQDARQVDVGYEITFLGRCHPA